MLDVTFTVSVVSAIILPSKTDIADYALETLFESQIEDIWLVGRRGPLQAAFTPVEAREFLEMISADVMLEGGPLKLDVESQLILETDASKDGPTASPQRGTLF